MKLITEQIWETTSLVEESSTGSKNLFITGPFLQSEVVNRNKRSYPDSIMLREVTKYNEKYVRKNIALGELSHRDYPIVEPDLASHRITEDIKKDGNNYIGKAIILNTPKGNIVKGLLEGGTQLGVSSRGLGDVKINENGVGIVQENYILNCIDIVVNPSAPDAFVNGIMEGAEWIYENELLVRKEVQINSMKENIEEECSKTKKDVQKISIQEFKKFLKLINTM